MPLIKMDKGFKVLFTILGIFLILSIIGVIVEIDKAYKMNKERIDACESLGGFSSLGEINCYKEDLYGMLIEYKIKKFDDTWRLVR